MGLSGCDRGRRAPLSSAVDRSRGKMVTPRSPAGRLEARRAAAPRAGGVPLGRRPVGHVGRRQPAGPVLVAGGPLLLLLGLVELDRCRFELADQRVVVGRDAGPEKLLNGGEAL